MMRSRPDKDNAHPRLPWGGPLSGAGGKPNPFVLARRIARNIFALLNPVAGLLAVPLVIGFTRRTVLARVRAWWVLLGGVAAAVLVLGVQGGLHTYLRPWVDLGRVAADHVLSGGLGPAVAHLVAESWRGWVIDQLPLGACLAVLVAGAEMWRRQRYRATWRSDDDDASAAWSQLTEREATRAHRQAEQAAGPKIDHQTPFGELVMRLGIDEKGRMVRLSGEHFRAHLVAIAPSGYGKTVTLTKVVQGWLIEWAARRLPAVVIDLKGDPKLRATIEAMCAESGRRCQTVTLRAGSATYNPLAHGTPAEIASRVLGTLAAASDGGFTEPHHRVVGQRWLNLAAAVLDALIRADAPTKRGEPWKRDLPHLAALMRPSTLIHHAAAIDALMKERAEDLHQEITETPELAKSIAGMRQRLANLTETGAEHVLNDEPDGISLYDAITRGDVILFSLSTGQNREAVQTIGNLLLSDLAATFGRLEEESWAERTDQRALVVLDEFGALGGTGLVELIERARSAGGSVLTSGQTEANFDEVSPEFKEKVYANANVWLLGRQEGDAAEARAKAIGTEKAWQETKQVTEDSDPLGSVTGASGVGSLRRVDQFVIHPNELRALGPGQIILRVGHPALLKRVRVTLPKKWEPAAIPAEVPAEDETVGEVETVAVDLAKQPPHTTEDTPAPSTRAKVSAAAAAEHSPTAPAAAGTGDPWADFEEETNDEDW